MFLDALGLVSDAQAFVAAAVSTNSVDLGNVTPRRPLGTGEPVGFGIQVDVAASSTTVKLEAIMATDGALTAGIVVLLEETRLSADLPLGGRLFLPLPSSEPAGGWLRFIGIRVTPAGGAATVTLTAWLTTASAFSVEPRLAPKSYPV